MSRPMRKDREVDDGVDAGGLEGREHLDGPVQLRLLVPDAGEVVSDALSLDDDVLVHEGEAEVGCGDGAGHRLDQRARRLPSSPLLAPCSSCWTSVSRQLQVRRARALRSPPPLNVLRAIIFGFRAGCARLKRSRRRAGVGDSSGSALHTQSTRWQASGRSPTVWRSRARARSAAAPVSLTISAAWSAVDAGEEVGGIAVVPAAVLPPDALDDELGMAVDGLEIRLGRRDRPEGSTSRRICSSHCPSFIRSTTWSAMERR